MKVIVEVLGTHMFRNGSEEECGVTIRGFGSSESYVTLSTRNDVTRIDAATLIDAIRRCIAPAVDAEQKEAGK